jgi:hypothetical protein
LLHHFLGQRAETPIVIYRSWGSPLLGLLAVANTVAIIATLLAMGINAVLVGRRSGWWPRTHGRSKIVLGDR